MPKEGEMAQISRPFQIALVALVLLVGVWLAALHGHPTSTTGAGSSPAAPTPAPATSGKGAAPGNGAAPGGVYNGSAPGVQGLTRALAKAHGAVTTSQQNAKQLEQKSNQASNSSAATGGSTAPAPEPAAPVKKAAPAAAAAPKTQHATSPSQGTARQAVKPTKSATQTGPQSKPAMQARVERALHQGKVAVVLFWNPKGADDVSTRNQLRLLESVHHLIAPVAGVTAVRRMLQRSGQQLQKKFAAFEASAKQVASFGSITRGVQVNQTPTLLVINKQGRVIALTGLIDAYSLEQAIDEARQR
jgi:hypothetical protein